MITKNINVSCFRNYKMACKCLIERILQCFGPSANVPVLMLSRQAASRSSKAAHWKNHSWLLCKLNTILSICLTFAFDTTTSFLSCLGSTWSQSEGRRRGDRSPVVRQRPIKMTYIPAPDGYACKPGVGLCRSLQGVQGTEFVYKKRIFKRLWE